MNEAQRLLSLYKDRNELNIAISKMPIKSFYRRGVKVARSDYFVFADQSMICMTMMTWTTLEDYRRMQ